MVVTVGEGGGGQQIRRCFHITINIGLLWNIFDRIHFNSGIEKEKIVENQKKSKYEKIEDI